MRERKRKERGKKEERICSYMLGLYVGGVNISHINTLEIHFETDISLKGVEFSLNNNTTIITGNKERVF